MKNKIAYSIFSILLSFIIVLPFTVQTLHALEGHEHTICTAKGEKHFHEQSSDCSIYHQTIEHNSINFLVKLDLKVPLFFNRIYTYYYQNKYTSSIQLKASRAPPYFIV